MMTLEEAKKMEGTEFTYIFADGDTVPAYVKKFDPKIGLTCLSLATETASGWKPSNQKVLETDGTFCVISVSTDPSEYIRVLEEIKDRGTYTQVSAPSLFSSFDGCVFS